MKSKILNAEIDTKWLTEIKPDDVGCAKTDEEFNARAVDLIEGADAAQFLKLAEFMSTAAFVLWLKNDPAYRSAAEKFTAAAEALRNRAGN